MLCPNCSKEQGDDAAECGNCGFILAKWRAAQAAQASGTAAPRPMVVEESGGQTWVLIVAGVLLVGGGMFFLYGSGDAGDSGEAGMALGPGYCALSGEVLDLYRLDPVKNAQLALKPKGQARSDKSGRFYAKVKAGIPYHIKLTHPDFDPTFIDGSWRDANFEQRVRASRLVAKAGLADDPSDKAYECASGVELSLTLGLVPKTITLDEKKDIDAVP